MWNRQNSAVIGLGVVGITLINYRFWNLERKMEVERRTSV
jgi:hypothetical protein